MLEKDRFPPPPALCPQSHGEDRDLLNNHTGILNAYCEEKIKGATDL